MHILFPIGSFYPSQAGGPSNSVYWLAEALVQAEHQVTVVTTGLDIPPDMRDRWADTEAGRVRYVSTRNHHLPLQMIWTALCQVPQADVVHLTSIFHAPSLPIALWSFLQKKKVLWSVRGELAPNALVFRRFLKKMYLSAVQMLRSAVVFHSTSPAETEQVQAIFGRQVRVIEVPNFMELPTQQERRSDHRFLLYIGRIHPIKALENLLDALATLGSTAAGLQLKIAGRGDAAYTDFLKKKAAALRPALRTEWLGEVTGEAKQQLLADAYCTLLVSHTENFGVSVTESLAQGTPVIASHGTPWQVLEKAGAGFWTANDPKSLAEAIDTMLQLPENEYTAMREQTLKLARERFDIHRNVHRWEEVYQQILQPHTRI